MIRPGLCIMKNVDFMFSFIKGMDDLLNYRNYGVIHDSVNNCMIYYSRYNGYRISDFVADPGNVVYGVKDGVRIGIWPYTLPHN